MLPLDTSSKICGLGEHSVHGAICYYQYTYAIIILLLCLFCALKDSVFIPSSRSIFTRPTYSKEITNTVRPSNCRG